MILFGCVGSLGARRKKTFIGGNNRNASLRIQVSEVWEKCNSCAFNFGVREEKLQMPQMWQQTAGKADFDFSGQNVEEKLKHFCRYYLAHGLCGIVFHRRLPPSKRPLCWPFRQATHPPLDVPSLLHPPSPLLPRSFLFGRELSGWALPHRRGRTWGRKGQRLRYEKGLRAQGCFD